MPWIKVPAENHAPFVAALPPDPRIEIAKMFGGLAAKVNGNIFAGLFGLSAMLLLDEPEKKKALALPGASMFDPMGDGRMRSDKVMLPPAMMKDPKGLSQWLGKAFQFGLTLPAKEAKPKKAAAAKKPVAPKKVVAQKPAPTAKKPAKKR